MAAPSRADVEGMITTALAEFEQRIRTHMQAMRTEQVFVADAQASLTGLADGTRQEFANFPSRIEQLRRLSTISSRPASMGRGSPRPSKEPSC